MNPVRQAFRFAADSVDLYLFWLTQTLRAAAPRAHGRMLDVGCGERRFEPMFTPYIESYTGVEHEGVFTSTDASARKNRPDVLYDGHKLPFEAGSYDTVLCTDVLEHTPEPGNLIGEMARVLRPKGTLILTAPFTFRLHEEPHDYFRYTPHGLTNMLERVGMRVLQIQPYGGLFSIVGHKLNSFLAFRVAHLQGLGRFLGKMGHESSSHGDRLRVWALPAVLPTMLGIAGAAHLLDRFAQDPTEALGYLVIGERLG